MGLIERIRASRSAETRVIGGVPWRPWDLRISFLEVFSQGGPIHPSRSFYGKDEALGLPALYSCVRLLADDFASLPVKLYTRNPRGDRRAVRYLGPSIFDQPSISGTLVDWLFIYMTSLLLQGNAWGFVTGRDGFGYPTGIEWIPPEDVNCVDDEQQPWNPLRTRIYVYGRLMSREELFHVKAFAVAGRTEGISPLRAFARTILSGIEASRYGTDWYSSGGFPPGHFKNSEIEIDADQAEQIRSMLVSTMRRREPLVYGRDWTYEPISVPPSEAQFVDAIGMNAGQMAAIYGLPPDRVGGKTGDSLHYSTSEQSTLQVIEALRPWIVRAETAFFSLIPSNRYVRLDSDALLKTDLKTRTEIYNVQRNIGLRTIDELRDLEDLEPLPDGVGNESIPLEVVVAMARTTRGIPKSMLPQLVLEMDLATEKLKDLQASGIAAPGQEPSVISPEQMLGRVMSSQRSASRDERDDADLIMDFLAARRAHRDAARERNEPEYVGAWIPSKRDLVLNGSGNGTREQLCRHRRRRPPRARSPRRTRLPRRVRMRCPAAAPAARTHIRLTPGRGVPTRWPGWSRTARRRRRRRCGPQCGGSTRIFRPARARVTRLPLRRSRRQVRRSRRPGNPDQALKGKEGLMAEPGAAREAINNLLDYQFAYVEDGGTRDASGRTTPRDKRHFAIHTEAAVRTALIQAPKSPFGKKAMPAIMSAARKFGIPVGGEVRAAFGDVELEGFPERRFTRFPPELRQARENGPSHIYGYAAAFNRLSRKLGGFVEQVAPSAFYEMKATGWPNVVCRYNHKDDALLGTTWAHTLTLAVDDTGLVYDVEPPNSRADVLEYVHRGDIKHSSFAFRVFPGGDEWGVSDFNYPMRTLLSVELVDVAPVLDPAYPDATAGVRAVQGAVESLASWVQADPEEVRSLLGQGKAMSFFKRPSADGGKPQKPQRAVPKRTMMTGQQALLALQANMEDPYSDEG